MKKSLLFGLLLALGGATTGCATGAGAASPPLVPSRDGSAIAALGEHARFGGLEMVPVSVEEDSRCPMNVQCIQAGTVRVNVRMVDKGRSISHTTMTLGELLPLESGGGLGLVAVCPYPRHPGSIPGTAYRFVFAVGVCVPPRPSEFTC